MKANTKTNTALSLHYLNLNPNLNTTVKMLHKELHSLKWKIC